MDICRKGFHNRHKICLVLGFPTNNGKKKEEEII